MAVRIRLKRTGRKNRPQFRICVFDKTTRRDGAPLEVLGQYDPIKDDFENRVDVDEDRLESWIDDGAKPTQNVKSILKKADKL